MTTITPPPVVTVTDQTYTTVTLRWSPAPNAPTPDLYTIYNTSTANGNIPLATVGGSQTSYIITQLIPGDAYTFAVSAAWGSAESELSQVSAPPLSAPLSGSVPVNLTVTQILPQSTGLTVGESLSDNWNFSASCQPATCTLTDQGSLVSNVGQFTAKLTPADGGYAGQASNVQYSHCAGVNSYVTVILRIYPVSGDVSDGAWISWHGTMALVYPGQTVGDSSCAGGDWDLTLTGTGSAAP